jgi:hypothetical protein
VWGYAGGGVDFCSDRFIGYIKELLAKKPKPSSKIEKSLNAVKKFFSW